MSKKLTASGARPPPSQTQGTMSGISHLLGLRKHPSQANQQNHTLSKHNHRAGVSPRAGPRSRAYGIQSETRTESPSESDGPVHAHQHQHVVHEMRSSGSSSAESSSVRITHFQSEGPSAASHRMTSRTGSYYDEKPPASQIGPQAGYREPGRTTVALIPSYEQVAAGGLMRRTDQRPVNHNIMSQIQSITNINHDHRDGEHHSIAERSENELIGDASISLNELQRALRGSGNHEKQHQPATHESEYHVGVEHSEAAYGQYRPRRGVIISPPYIHEAHQAETSSVKHEFTGLDEPNLEDDGIYLVRQDNDVSKDDGNTSYRHHDYEHEPEMPDNDHDDYYDHGEEQVEYDYNDLGYDQHAQHD